MASDKFKTELSEQELSRLTQQVKLAEKEFALGDSYVERSRITLKMLYTAVDHYTNILITLFEFDYIPQIRLLLGQALHRKGRACAHLSLKNVEGEQAKTTHLILARELYHQAISHLQDFDDQRILMAHIYHSMSVISLNFDDIERAHEEMMAGINILKHEDNRQAYEIKALLQTCLQEYRIKVLCKGLKISSAESYKRGPFTFIVPTSQIIANDTKDSTVLKQKFCSP
jgi:hypothetical protein